MNKTIIVTISPVGKTKIEAEGFVGGACLKATKPIQDALSSSTATEKDFVVEEKPELHQGSHGAESIYA